MRLALSWALVVAVIGFLVAATIVLARFIIAALIVGVLVAAIIWLLAFVFRAKKEEPKQGLLDRIMNYGTED